METKRTSIIDRDGNMKLANVTESSSVPGIFGIVVLNPDGSPILGGGGPGGDVVFTNKTQTLTNKRINKRVITDNAPGATPSSDVDNADIFEFTGLNTAITSMTTNLTGTPVNGQLIEWIFIDDGTARAITWGSSFTDGPVATLPTTTTISTVLRVLTQYQTIASLNKHVCIAVA